jgi:hypothetical protein
MGKEFTVGIEGNVPCGIASVSITSKKSFTAREAYAPRSV